ncbi:DegT/DnrJ/EryC1/StrS family aminotransferase [Mesorhizobium sp. M1148]|uniref:DegT/DnrJ/EryC1/StrS family aminotransferase n=1 Tax=unclassified Mesorhizobium TaxID=325217 RepID=UPI000401E5E6|nr:MULTISPECIES: DegT/DnrJ/EryC1/StrS family aminotransferase [unclassified Mesorhizobium]
MSRTTTRDQKGQPVTAPERRRFDSAERQLLDAALAGQELWPYTSSGDPKRNFWNEAREALENYYSDTSGERLRAVPAGSGTAAIHVALGGLQIPAGTEVIVPPITDMGTVMPVIFQNAIPVFADLDPNTGLLTAETIARVATSRTSAVIVVHLGGSPADMDPILDFCRQHNIKVIEDAAQAQGASYKGRPAGTRGDAGCFSLNSQKHITCGEGGFVLVRSEDDFLRCLNFSDKHRNRTGVTDPNSEHYIYNGSGVNYRMSDLEFAMLLAQLPKLAKVAARFTAVGQRLDERLSKIPGVRPQQHHGKAISSYFFQMFRLEPDLVARREDVLKAMRAAATSVGMGVGKSYGDETLYRTGVFRNRNFFDTFGQPNNETPIWPAELVARQIFPDIPETVFDYKHTHCPEAERWIESSLQIVFHDGHEPHHADIVADAIETVLSI